MIHSVAEARGLNASDCTLKEIDVNDFVQMDGFEITEQDDACINGLSNEVWADVDVGVQITARLLFKLNFT